MNKAFVREPDDNGERFCPRCKSLGIATPTEAVAARVRPEARAGISDAPFFCPFPQCEVAYFDLFDRVVTIDALVEPVYPKDPDAPICACFGLTRDDVEEDLREGGVRRVRDVVQRSKTAEAQCLGRAATGKSCAADVQRYYMKRRQELEAR